MENSKELNETIVTNLRAGVKDYAVTPYIIDEAESQYNFALTVKPEDDYPKQKLYEFINKGLKPEKIAIVQS